MWNYNHTQYLEHVGVRGMRWGKRHNRPDPTNIPRHNRYDQRTQNDGGAQIRNKVIRGDRVVSTVLAGAGGAMLARSATRTFVTRNKNAGLVAGILGGALGATAITAINASQDRRMQEYEDYGNY